jgi:hypothetical protein
MVMKKYDKTFDEMKKEFEKEMSPEELHDMLDMVLKYILDNFDIFMFLNDVKYDYEIGVDKNSDFIVKLNMHGSGSNLETSFYNIDKAITRVLKVAPEDKAYRITSKTVNAMYRIKKEVVQHIKMSEVERELGKTDI